MIQIVLDPGILEREKQAEAEKNKPLTTEQRFKTMLVIRNQKIARIVTGSYIGFKQ
jgi:hypothetical protein